MDALRIQNEKTIALGNMNVNAAGDELGKSGAVTKTSTQRVKESNRSHTMRPQDTPVRATAAPRVSKTPEQGLIEAESILDKADDTPAQPASKNHNVDEAEAILDEAKAILEEAKAEEVKPAKKVRKKRQTIKKVGDL